MKIMRKAVLVVLFLGMAILAVEAGQEGSLEVTLQYQGPQSVDGEHRLWVWVFSDPNIGQPGVVPVAMGSTDSNGGTVRFEDLPDVTVYLAAMYDINGGYGNPPGPPPPGSPVTMHGEAGFAHPVELKEAEAVKVEMTFDDSFKMP